MAQSLHSIRANANCAILLGGVAHRRHRSAPLRIGARGLLLLSLAGAACLLPPPVAPNPLSRFAPFFNMVEKQVRGRWNPYEAYRRADPTGTLSGQRSTPYASSYTELAVALTAEGGLLTLEVAEPSGLQFLDEEAVAAFRRAAPFPPPPQGAIDRDGILRFRFGFWFDPIVGSTQLSWTKPADERRDGGPGQRDAR